MIELLALALKRVNGILLGIEYSIELACQGAHVRCVFIPRRQLFVPNVLLVALKDCARGRLHLLKVLKLVGCPPLVQVWEAEGLLDGLADVQPGNARAIVLLETAASGETGGPAAKRAKTSGHASGATLRMITNPGHIVCETAQSGLISGTVRRM